MHSLLKVAVGCAVVVCVRGAVIKAPATTPAPDAAHMSKRQDPDAISFGLVLLTGVPESLREIAATNLPALPSILREDFMENRRPVWFLELPPEIRSYLIKKFGPETAWPTGAPPSSVLDGSATLTAITSATAEPNQTFWPPGPGENSHATGAHTRPAESVVESTPTASSVQTNGPDSFTTSYAITSDASMSQSLATPTEQQTLSATHGADTSITPSPTSDPKDLASPNDGLSRNQKVGLGIGIPFGLVAATALVFGCCALCRRRKRKTVEGSIPPESPGFIPRFAFQEKYKESLEHHTPLNHDIDRGNGTAWDEESVDAVESMHTQPNLFNSLGTNDQASFRAQVQAPSDHSALGNDVDVDNIANVQAMMMRDPKPVMAPALYHTHTSNRARGKRTSYTSLHSVAEVSESDGVESPVLGRRAPPQHSPVRDFLASSLPTGAQIKRKPVPSSPPFPLLPTSPSPVAIGPAGQTTSHTLTRQKMPEHSGSSSSGLALSTSTGLTSVSSFAAHAESTSPVSPSSNRSQNNPFHYDSYIEDYGPEYQNGYVDVEDGLYGGNTSLQLLSQYAAEPRRKNPKTEWPLRNLIGSHHRRRSSPIWERIYEE